MVNTCLTNRVYSCKCCIIAVFLLFLFFNRWSKSFHLISSVSLFFLPHSSKQSPVSVISHNLISIFRTCVLLSKDQLCCIPSAYKCDTNNGFFANYIQKCMWHIFQFFWVKLYLACKHFIIHMQHFWKLSGYSYSFCSLFCLMLIYIWYSIHFIDVPRDGENWVKKLITKNTLWTIFGQKEIIYKNRLITDQFQLLKDIKGLE